MLALLRTRAAAALAPAARPFGTKKTAWELLLQKQRRKADAHRLRLERKRREARTRARAALDQGRMREAAREMLELADMATDEAAAPPAEKKNAPVVR